MIFFLSKIRNCLVLFLDPFKMRSNGPAIWGGCVTRRNSGRAPVPVLWQSVSFGRKRRVWRTFCRPPTKFSEHYECRGTSLIGAGKLSRYRIFVGSTRAVSRYNLSRSQKSVTVQDLNWGQVRVSGYKFWQDLSWEQK